ncbi:insertion element IS1 5 protein insB [Escherichia coli KTE73]|nr:insertion element IS1 8 protein insB [Escherichia coli KTE73]EOV78249.1 insertion element IS1 5 protein insB [Escherichia coli KTE73]EOV78707.1 insertion element IS1 5 protein insB [Escherichia coli KTE73]
MPGNSPHYGRWPQHDFTSLKKLRPQSVTSRIQPGSDVIVCAEMDEQWGYVGAKSRQRWLFYAYDRLRKTVVAHVFGERTMATLGRLMSLLSPFDVVIWMTDGWPLYESRLKGKLHVISKRYTQRIERHNLNLRQHLARLGRSVFEVLQWLLFLSAVPPVQLLTGWCVTAKAPPDISAISALTAVKHGNCSSLTPLLNPVRTRKSLIWP